MSSKRLSKSAIEGGRRPYNKYDRKQSHREQRAVVREYCYKAKSVDDFAEEASPAKRRRVSKQFDDHLGAMIRWLRSHVGQPWNDVKSKAHKLYDSRTTAGRHILYDHLLSEVAPVGAPLNNDLMFSFHDFGVDEAGLLQYTENNRYTNSHRKRRRAEEKADYPGKWIHPKAVELYAWAGHRKVIDYGSVQFWTADPDRMTWGICQCGYFCYYPSKDIQTTVASRDFITKAITTRAVTKRHCYHPVIPAYRQGKKFNKEESAYWAKIHPTRRTVLLFDKDK